MLHAVIHFHMACDRYDRLQVKIEDSAVPHEGSAPGKVHNGLAVPGAKPVIYAMAHRMPVLCKARCLQMAAAAADRIVP